MIVQWFVGGPRDGERAAGAEQGADELWVVQQEITPEGELVGETRHHYVADAFGRYVYQGEVSA